MTEDDTPGVRLIETHEEFIQHLESGSSKIRILSLLTMAVAFLLLGSYFSQLLIPFTTGTRFVVVDLLDPTLLALQVLLIVITFVWLYVGVANYLFAKRVISNVKAARARENELEKKVS